MPQNEYEHEDANGGSHFESNNQEQEEEPQNSNAHEGNTKENGRSLKKRTF
ncbi:hypothetical protein PIB30_041791 [Stylosanthes scabra]|uniref:Uncharacterized protein n=1 Tax=Stylosanthes scabra TaxID=79078 RepID=A0ABU6WEQ8_9FABA|nr:hypothetical protein [Stylosanthes scabra]